MTHRIILLGLTCLIVLPSCAHPLDRVMQARAEARQSNLESTGLISSGACDDVGQFIARDRAQSVSLGVEASAMPTR